MSGAILIAAAQLKLRMAQLERREALSGNYMHSYETTPEHKSKVIEKVLEVVEEEKEIDERVRHDYGLGKEDLDPNLNTEQDIYNKFLKASKIRSFKFLRLCDEWVKNNKKMYGKVLKIYSDKEIGSVIENADISSLDIVQKIIDDAPKEKADEIFRALDNRLHIIKSPMEKVEKHFKEDGERTYIGDSKFFAEFILNGKLTDTLGNRLFNKGISHEEAAFCLDNMLKIHKNNYKENSYYADRLKEIRFEGSRKENLHVRKLMKESLLRLKKDKATPKEAMESVKFLGNKQFFPKATAAVEAKARKKEMTTSNSQSRTTPAGRE